MLQVLVLALILVVLLLLLHFLVFRSFFCVAFKKETILQILFFFF